MKRDFEFMKKVLEGAGKTSFYEEFRDTFKDYKDNLPILEDTWNEIATDVITEVYEDLGMDQATACVVFINGWLRYYEAKQLKSLSNICGRGVVDDVYKRFLEEELKYLDKRYGYNVYEMANAGGFIIKELEI